MIFSFEELKNFVQKKDTYFVFGDPISHSLSPKLHSKFFQMKNIDAEYIGVHVKENQLRDAIDIVKGYAKGVNLTIPHKKAVIPMLDYIDETAKSIGAVNTLVFENGKIKGYNTDYYGLILTLEKYNYNPENKKILILGNGGVAQAFLNVSLKFSNDVTVLGRNREKVDMFCKNTIAKPALISDIENEKFQLILNGTPLGMSENADKLPISIDFIKEAEFVFDSVYNPLNTNLTTFASIYNVNNANGLYMLIYQGLKAQQLWGNEFLSDDVNPIFDELKNDFGKTKNNIVLTGYMGCGKSTCAKMLEERTGRIFVDTDLLIEETQNLSVSEIFDKFGEEYFREKETEIIKKVARLNGVIISTGGGVIKNETNIELLRKNGKIFFLNPDIEEIENRIFYSTNRPLIKDKNNIRKIHTERLPLYKKYADYILSNNSTTESVGEIIEITKEFF